MSAIRSLSGEQRTLSKRAQQAQFICALATPLSADFLPRSGLVQYLNYDPSLFELSIISVAQRCDHSQPIMIAPLPTLYPQQ
jgi:hypothetical protein